MARPREGAPIADLNNDLKTLLDDETAVLSEDGLYLIGLFNRRVVYSQFDNVRMITFEGGAEERVKFIPPEDEEES